MNSAKVMKAMICDCYVFILGDFHKISRLLPDAMMIENYQGEIRECSRERFDMEVSEITEASMIAIEMFLALDITRALGIEGKLKRTFLP